MKRLLLLPGSAYLTHRCVHRDCACKAGGESGELLFTDIEPKRADYEESRDRDPIHLERRTELYRELTQ